MVALDHVDHVEAEIAALVGGSPRSTMGLIDDRRREIGATFKRAEILACLAVADAVDNLARTLATMAAPAEGAGPRTSHSRAIFESAMTGRGGKR